MFNFKRVLNKSQKKALSVLQCYRPFVSLSFQETAGRGKTEKVQKLIFCDLSRINSGSAKE